MCVLEVFDDVEVLFPNLGKVQLFNVHQAQQFAYWLGHVAAALVAGAAALSHADLGPEFLLVEAKFATNLARVKNLVKEFHGGPNPVDVGNNVKAVRFP